MVRNVPLTSRATEARPVRLGHPFVGAVGEDWLARARAAHVADTTVFHVPHDRIHAQISAVLAAWGMPADVVRTAADIMTDTDLAGIDSHGISMLMLYEEALGLNQLNPDPKPRVVRETPVIAVIDGDGGLGHVSAVMGMVLAITKAKAAGGGIVSVFNA